jgi:hypothetical protein
MIIPEIKSGNLTLNNNKNEPIKVIFTAAGL